MVGKQEATWLCYLQAKVVPCLGFPEPLVHSAFRWIYNICLHLSIHLSFTSSTKAGIF